MQSPTVKNASIPFPLVSVITIADGHVAVLTDEGEIITHRLSDRMPMAAIIKQSAVLTCHAPWVASKLELASLPQFDILELFAFCRPAQFITPTLNGLAGALNIEKPADIDDMPFSLIEIAQALLAELTHLDAPEKAQCLSIATAMTRQGHGWAWGSYVMAALGGQYDEHTPTNPKRDMDVFENLPEWAEDAPPPPHSFKDISGDETRDYLQTLLNRRNERGQASQVRAQQQNYATRIANNLAPKTNSDSPNLLIAKAGTGIGKTYGYLAPAQLWTEKNEGRITVSTYTKNLQRQIEQDLDILYPDSDERSRKAVIQKGRENYLCLLNLEDLISASALAQNPKTIIAAGIMARWVMATNDGDLTGNSFPGWLSGLLGTQNTLALADRRGECIFAACDHYHKCFIERMNRKAKRARIVINNHALTMIRAATESSDAVTPFIVFDEAHHLFHAADSAYGANFTGMDTADLRRWIVGPEDERRKGRVGNARGRGLRKRLEGLVDEDTPAFMDIGKILIAAKESLPAPAWRKRVFHHDPFGDIEKFLSSVAAHVNTRAKGANGPYSIECDVFPVSDNFIETAKNAHKALKKLRVPLADLVENLKAMMEDKADDLDKDTLARLDSLSASIERRSTMMVAAWMNMLETLIDQKTTDDMVDWFEIARIDGKNYDCGFMRRYKNPMEPLGNSLRDTAQGIVMTSATLKSQNNDDANDWQSTFQLLGTNHLTNAAPESIDLPSPFQYDQQSKIIVVTDVDKNNGIAVANAYKAIFEASKGGGLGLFTSINRLKQVHKSISDTLERQSISLYAQHHDNIDIGTLTDMFREDDNACLLGTDAVRDGIDVSGRSLRCMVFDRVPWPRPTILHRERRKIFGGRAYDENQTRLKLKQAFGRLIRSENDKGVFVMLDGAMPTRLCDAFPNGVNIERIPLKDAIKVIKEFM
jgi:ATP-dependent DNA helicase DinG